MIRPDELDFSAWSGLIRLITQLLALFLHCVQSWTARLLLFLLEDIICVPPASCLTASHMKEIWMQSEWERERIWLKLLMENLCFRLHQLPNDRPTTAFLLISHWLSRNLGYSQYSIALYLWLDYKWENSLISHIFRYIFHCCQAGFKDFFFPVFSNFSFLCTFFLHHKCFQVHFVSPCVCGSCSVAPPAL